MQAVTTTGIHDPTDMTSDSYEIYIDLRMTGPDPQDSSREPKLTIVESISIETHPDQPEPHASEAHWGLTDALVTRGAGSHGTALPAATITDRPNRLRRKPGLWERFKRALF